LARLGPARRFRTTEKKTWVPGTSPGTGFSFWSAPLDSREAVRLELPSFTAAGE
jgi:hypothetical protein